MRTIVAAVDGTEHAPVVASAAAELASQNGATLVLLRVVAPQLGLPSHVLTAGSVEPTVSVAIDEARRALARLQRELPPSVRVVLEVGVGTPWREICRVANLLGAELLVLGAHGYSPLERMLGTTAASVVNHAPCSVLLARTRSIFESSN